MLEVCTKRRKVYGCSVALGVGMSGFPEILIKNHVCALILSVIAHIGRNPVETKYPKDRRKAWQRK